MDGRACLGKSFSKRSLRAACLNTAFQRQTLGKMSRILIHLTVTIVISGELMKRQLFYLLLNIESRLDNSPLDLLKWLIHTHGCTHTHSYMWTHAGENTHVTFTQMSINSEALLFSLNTIIKTKRQTCCVHTDTHCTRGDYKLGCGQFSWFHYVKAESLECIAADNDMMIRGCRREEDLCQQSDSLWRITNCLCQNGVEHIRVSHAATLPELHHSVIWPRLCDAYQRQTYDNGCVNNVMACLRDVASDLENVKLIYCMCSNPVTRSWIVFSLRILRYY